MQASHDQTSSRLVVRRKMIDVRERKNKKEVKYLLGKETGIVQNSFYR
jgi:hypothetical protein